MGSNSMFTPCHSATVRALFTFITLLACTTLAGPTRADNRMDPELVPQIGSAQQFSPESARIAPRLPRNAVLAIELSDTAEILKKKAQGPRLGVPKEIGLGRPLPKEYQGGLDHLLTWTRLDDGGYFAVVEISSPGAHGIRAGMRAAANGGVEFRFFDAENTQTGLPAYVPKPASATALEPVAVYWSPTVRSEVLVIEVYAKDWDAVSSLQLEIDRISHIFADPSFGSGIPAMTPQSGANSCVGEPAACGRVSSCAQQATVYMYFVKPDGNSYSCTGTLINDDRELSEKNNNAHLYTAHHCIDSQSAAQTLELHFHHADTSCTDTTSDIRYRINYGGADLLETLPENDQSFLRLRSSLNANDLCFAGWDANPLTLRIDVVGVHHPGGRHKEWLAGRTRGYGTTPDGVELMVVDLTEGRTEAGSSGSGLFSDEGGGDPQRLLGTHHGSDPDNCTQVHYGALSEFYPQIRPYLRNEVPPPPAADDHGNSRSAATAISVNSSVSGRLDPAGDIDYFTFTIDIEGDVTIESTGTTDTIGAIYDSNGRELQSDDDGGNQQNFHLSLRLAPGTYYVSVEGYGGAAVGDYEISVQHESTPAFARAIPLMLAADAEGRQGFLRIQNYSSDATDVEIRAIDNGGQRYGPLRIRLGPWQSAHFNSTDIEKGNPDKGLNKGLGDGQGWWRLQLRSSTQIFATSYVRTPDGFLTSIHDTTPAFEGEDISFLVPMFNPASNVNQQSYLWFTNLSRQTNNISVYGVDDAGVSGLEAVRFSIDGMVSVTLDAKELESGIPDINSGRFGDGKGKWRLIVEADQPLRVLSLMVTPQGHITNLSTLSFETPADGGANAQNARRERLDLEAMQLGVGRHSHGTGGDYPLLSPRPFDGP